jgi:hypothetical protein
LLSKPSPSSSTLNCLLPCDCSSCPPTLLPTLSSTCKEKMEILLGTRTYLCTHTRSRATHILASLHTHNTPPS